MRVEGRVALVTGASRGIGAGIARCMAQEGAAVVVNYVQSEALANEVVKEIRDGGGSAIAIQAGRGELCTGEVDGGALDCRVRQGGHTGQQCRDRGAVRSDGRRNA